MGQVEGGFIKIDGRLAPKTGGRWNWWMVRDGRLILLYRHDIVLG